MALNIRQTLVFYQARKKSIAAISLSPIQINFFDIVAIVCLKKQKRRRKKGINEKNAEYAFLPISTQIPPPFLQLI
jgi:hypothetical protein